MLRVLIYFARLFIMWVGVKLMGLDSLTWWQATGCMLMFIAGTFDREQWMRGYRYGLKNNPR